MATLQELKGGTGCVLQVKRTFTNSAQNQQSASGNTPITGLTVDITPKASGSSFVCNVRWNGFVGASRDTGLTIQRDGSVFNQGDTGQAISQAIGDSDLDNYVNGTPMGASMTVTNTAGSTAGQAITFRGCVNHENSSHDIRTNRLYNGGTDETMSSEIVVWEIGGTGL